MRDFFDYKYQMNDERNYSEWLNDEELWALLFQPLLVLDCNRDEIYQVEEVVTFDCRQLPQQDNLFSGEYWNIHIGEEGKKERKKQRTVIVIIHYCLC